MLWSASILLREKGIVTTTPSGDDIALSLFMFFLSQFCLLFLKERVFVFWLCNSKSAFRKNGSILRCLVFLWAVFLLFLFLFVWVLVMLVAGEVVFLKGWNG